MWQTKLITDIPKQMNVLLKSLDKQHGLFDLTASLNSFFGSLSCDSDQSS